MSYNAKDTIQKKGMEQKKYLKQWVIIMSSVLPMLKSNTIPKAQIIPNKINSTPHQTHTHTKTKNRTKRLHLHISIFSFKKPKINFKIPPQKTAYLQKNQYKNISDFSSETMQARWEWSEIFKLKGKAHPEFCTLWNDSSKVKN